MNLLIVNTFTPFSLRVEAIACFSESIRWWVFESPLNMKRRISNED
jgi:hypothetical protein